MSKMCQVIFEASEKINLPMEFKKMKKLVIIIVVGFFVLTVNMNLLAMIMGNDSCLAFPQACEPGGDSSDSEGLYTPQSFTIGQLIIEGAGYYLNSNGEYQRFLNNIELSELNGIDYESLKGSLNGAITNMENAAKFYKILIDITKSMPYNQSVIEKLIEFDYFDFQENLNPSIFKRVECLLSVGNVKGVYETLKSDMDLILTQLYKVRLSIESGRFPEIEALWKLNQDYSSSMLFGQYTAMVFYEIKKSVD